MRCHLPGKHQRQNYGDEYLLLTRKDRSMKFNLVKIIIVC